MSTVTDPGFPRISFGKIFAENCMEMKEIGPRRSERVPSAALLDPPMIKVLHLTNFHSLDLIGINIFLV